MLDEHIIEKLIALGTECEFDPGQVMLELGVPGSGLYLIQHGTVFVHAPEGDREVGPGEVVGELALLSDDGVRSARCVAKTAVRAIAVDRATLEREGLIR
jgi:CRP-like cAMP-binding protein